MDIFATLQQDESAHTKISRCLVSGECTLVTVVESLETLLVNKDVNQRCSGVSHLAKILSHIPSTLLNTDEASFIAAFFVDRCKDHFKVMPSVIQCIRAVACQRNLSDSALASLLRCLYNDCHTQSLMLEERLHVFAVYSHVLSSRAEVVREMGADFVTGFIQSVDGEKEPRCLLAVLSASHALLLARPQCLSAAGDSASLRDELFDVISCYFPVDFTPPEGAGGHGVTRQLLADSLAGCLTATPLFSDAGLIPLVLEKLESDVEVARDDAVNVLARCCRDWPAHDAIAALRCHASRLRVTLSRVCLYRLLSTAQLAALLRLVTRISCLLTEPRDGLAGQSDDVWCQPLIEQCLHLLCQPESVQSVRPAVDLLTAIASAGSTSLSLVVHAAGPTVCEQLERRDDVSVSFEWRSALFYSVAKLLAVSGARVCVTDALRQRLAALITSMITAADLQLLTAAVSALASASWLLEGCSNDDEPLTTTCRQLCHLYTDQTVQCETSCLSAIASCVTSLYRQYSECVTMVILRPLLDSLVSNDECCLLTERQLKLVSACVVDADSVRVSVPLLCVRLMKSGRVMSQASCLQTLTTLQAIVNGVCGGGELHDSAALHCLLDEVRLLDKLIELLVSAARDVEHDPRVPLIETTSSHPLLLSAVVESVGRLVATLVRCMECRRAGETVDSCVSLFLQQDGAPLLKALGEKWRALAPLVHQSPWQHTQLVILLASVIGAADLSQQSKPHNGAVSEIFPVQSDGGHIIGDSGLHTNGVCVVSSGGSANATDEHSSADNNVSSIVPIPQLPVLSGLLTRLALKKRHRVSARWAARLLAVLHNKLDPAQPTVARLLQQTAEHCRELWSRHTAGCDGDPEVTTAVLTLWTCLTRGLVLAGHPAAEQFVTQLLEWLDDVKLGEQVAEVFGRLLVSGSDDDDDLLSRDNHCRVRLLYKQWLFSVVWRRLVDTEGSGGGESVERLSMVRLTVLGAMLTSLPAAAVAPYLPRLVAPLASGLDLLLSSSSGSSSSCDDSGVDRASIQRAGASCLQLLVSTAEQRPQLLEQHVDTLLPRLLTLAETTRSQISTRADALRCVWRLASLTVHRLLPMRGEVLRRLQTCLADHKRLVRQQAVGASNAWHLVGAATDSKTT